MEYNFSEIEKHWRKYWQEEQLYKVTNDGSRPKFYILDMFPYPSGAGLHVGHPLGYIASDIFARYKRAKGYNVLHPMGYDAFGLPAEQYAIETGQHPAKTTEVNIARYRQQLDNIGFSFDWSREVRTSDPSYYKWTQWMFVQLFHSYYDRKAGKARPLSELITAFEKNGTGDVSCPADEMLSFTKEQWKAIGLAEQRNILMKFRLAYQDYAEVWWCEALGTVLANDEVVNGVSERGGHPVVKKQMRQWFLRITEYAERLLDGLESLDWTDAMKEMQRNWIGKSRGAEIAFDVKNSQEKIKVFTTRPDTIFGVDFMVLAPEHDLVGRITTEEYQPQVAEYKLYVQSRSERERISEVKQVSGAFTGAYAVHPFSRRPIPIWISEYVLAGYGTGAIMAVPSGDERDYAFARHFQVPITNIFGALYKGDAAYTEKAGRLEGSDFLNGLDIPKATEAAIRAVEDAGIGRGKVNYRLRDAGFSRQRYWGEPFPVIYHNGIPFTVDEPEVLTPALSKGEGAGAGRGDVSPSFGGGGGEDWLVSLPHVESYAPGPEGEGPLANIPDWVNTPVGKRETNTMPGYAGSSWYFLRYMDPHNDEAFAGRNALDYWQQVDVYVGGTEHAVGHLLYARFFTKVLSDLGFIGFDEPFKKLVNQGMIQGSSRTINLLTYSFQDNIEQRVLPPIFVSVGIAEKIVNREIASYPQVVSQIIESVPGFQGLSVYDFNGFGYEAKRVDVQIVDGIELKIDQFKNWRPENAEARFITEDDGKFLCGTVVEKMSKSKYNVINPDDIVTQYGADTFRMYEMFLGPIEMSKPWDTQGIEGVHRFLKKLWRLYYNDNARAVSTSVPLSVNSAEGSGAEGSATTESGAGTSAEPALSVAEGLSDRAYAASGWQVTEDEPSAEALRIIHKTIKKVGDDIERFSFNTAVSEFMICVNELSRMKCANRTVLEALVVLLAPFAPHIAEELWQHGFGHESSVHTAPWPAYEEHYLTETTKKYPIAVNGKPRTELEFPLDASESAIQKEVLADAIIQKWLEGRPPKKIIFVKGKMVNVVV